MKIKANQIPSDDTQVYTQWNLEDELGDEWIVRRYKLTNQWEYESLTWDEKKEDWVSETVTRNLVPHEILNALLVS